MARAKEEEREETEERRRDRRPRVRRKRGGKVDGHKAPHRLDKRARGGAFNPGGHKGKLHRELGIPEGQKIPQDRLAKAEHSSNPEVRRDAIRAKTMEGWHHVGSRKRKR